MVEECHLTSAGFCEPSLVPPPSPHPVRLVPAPGVEALRLRGAHLPDVHRCGAGEVPGLSGSRKPAMFGGLTDCTAPASLGVPYSPRFYQFPQPHGSALELLTQAHQRVGRRLLGGQHTTDAVANVQQRQRFGFLGVGHGALRLRLIR